MANPTVLIEVKTIGADKAEKSVKRITIEVDKAEKATTRLRNTTQSSGAAAVAAANKAAAAEARRAKQIAAASLSMKQFAASVRKAGAPGAMVGTVAAAFKRLQQTLSKTGISAKEAARAIDRYQTTLLRAKARLVDFKKAQERATESGMKLAGSLNRTGAAVRKLGKDEEKTGKKTDGLKDRLRNLGSTATLAVGPLSGIGARVIAFGAIVARGGIKLAAFLLILTALVVLAAKAIVSFAKMETALLKVEAVLEATTNASRITVAQINKLSIAFGKATLNSIAAGREIFTIFASFRLPGDLFERAANAAEGLGAVLGTDTVSGARTLARALADPEQGAQLLRRTIGELDESLKFQILTLVSLNKKWEATDLLLKQVEKRMGDVAGIQAKGLEGAINGLSDAWDDFLESLGGKLFVSGLTAGIKLITSLVEGLREGLDLLTKAASFTVEIFFLGLGKIIEILGKLALSIASITALPDSIANVFFKIADGLDLAASRLNAAAKVQSEFRNRPPAIIPPIERGPSPSGFFGKNVLDAIAKEARQTSTNIRLVNLQFRLLTTGVTQLEPGVVKLLAKFGVLDIVLKALKDKSLKGLSEELSNLNRLFKEDRNQKAANALFLANATAAETFSGEVNKLNVLLADGAIQQADYNLGLTNLRTRLVESDPLLSKIKGGIDAVGAGFAEAINSTDKFGDVMKRVARSIIDDLIAMVIQLGVVNTAINALFGTNFKTLGSGGIGSLLKSFLGGIGGGAPVPFGGSFGGLPGTVFSHGGSLKVGGSGGTDSQAFNIRATPGELITVKTPQQVKESEGGTVFNVDMRGADKEAVLRLEKFVRELDASIEPRAVQANVAARQSKPRLFEGR